MRQRKWVHAAIGLTVVAGAFGLASRYWPADEARATVVAPTPRSVDPTVPEAKLLDSVLYVDDWREFGNPVGFTYVPKSRPPGLLSVGPGNPPNLNGGSHRGSGNGALLDGYRIEAAGSKIFVVVEFAAEPTSTCAAFKGETHAVCVRDSKAIEPEPEDVALRRTTAYLTADSSAPLKTREAEAAKRFWATVDMVPVAEAAWFTDLVTRAEASVQN